ncbi:glycosyltransferase [Butyrivibrio sp. NC3005]|uniref:glycosyltransferase n=1 Tax=Butyrivibrio sp. NC3005 TaxID=1280685 RepID=UPI000417A075|nr:glycosyltransferase [Butyrivibrio sp. NC3005]
MNIVLFGTGDYYNKYKNCFREDDIVALLDNDSNKIGMIIDNKTVFCPRDINSIDYDIVVILSVHSDSMRNQLISYGVKNEKVILYSDLVKRKDLIKSHVWTQVFVQESRINDVIESMITKKSVLFMSHNLDLNGASLAFYYAAKYSKEIGYDVIFVSWSDGKLREYLEKDGIPIIIEQSLEIMTANDIAWIDKFSRIVCNTLNYYQFLSDKNENRKYIWWLHDPDFFYRSINVEIMKTINFDNMYVYAAGFPAKQAIKKYIPNIHVEILHYGLPDVLLNNDELLNGMHNQLNIVCIANVQNYKGQDILIDAIELMPQEERELLHIMFIGNYESAYGKEQKKRAEKLKNAIEFVGVMEKTEIENVLDVTDLLICPSREDVMPVSVCEAMRKAIPSIVSNTVGTAELITDSVNGFVFESENSLALKIKIEWCIRNMERLKNIGKEARKIYEDYFSISVFCKKWKTMLKKCFNDKL